MDNIKIIELKESILKDNDEDAEKLRMSLKSKKIFFMNLMSSPGSGKTTTLLALNQYLKNYFNIGILEADIDGQTDTETMLKNNISSIQLHTGGMCHLDADMVRQGLNNFDYEKFNFIVLENIGNLVCPAEYDTGASLNMTLLSVPEGDDKPLKYPLMYQKSDILVVNKIDALPVFDFNKDLMEKYALNDNKNIKIFYISAKTGEGVDKLAAYLKNKAEEWIN